MGQAPNCVSKYQIAPPGGTGIGESRADYGAETLGWRPASSALPSSAQLKAARICKFVTRIQGNIAVRDEPHGVFPMSNGATDNRMTFLMSNVANLSDGCACCYHDVPGSLKEMAR
jgi:hypothetical protein